MSFSKIVSEYFSNIRHKFLTQKSKKGHRVRRPHCVRYAVEVYVEVVRTWRRAGFYRSAFFRQVFQRVSLGILSWFVRSMRWHGPTLPFRLLYMTAQNLMMWKRKLPVFICWECSPECPANSLIAFG